VSKLFTQCVGSKEHEKVLNASFGTCAVQL
jgi:hypothetical protein